MDSTRGGPLSTLILMLPLVIVPAIALLRPAERDSGFVGGEVGATEEDGFTLGPSDFDDIFGDEDSASGEQPDGFRQFGDDEQFQDSADEASPFFNDEDLSDSESPRPIRRREADTDRSGPPRNGAAGTSESRSRRLPDLTHLGVRHSLWFAPGSDNQYGFVAFVSSDRPGVRYRFSAIHNTEARAVADVAEQIRAWQQELRGDKIRREQ